MNFKRTKSESVGGGSDIQEEVISSKADYLQGNSVSLRTFERKLDKKIERIVKYRKPFSDRILMDQEYDRFMKDITHTRFNYTNGINLLTILNRVETEMREEMMMGKSKSKIDYSSITTTEDLSSLLDDQNRMDKDNTFSQTITRMIHLVMISVGGSLGLHLHAFLHRVMTGMRGLHGYDKHYCTFLKDVLITDFQYDHKKFRRTFLSLTVPAPEDLESLNEYGLRVYREGTHSILMILENSAELAISKASVYEDYKYSLQRNAFISQGDQIPRCALFCADSNNLTSNQAVFILNTIHVVMKNMLQSYLDKMFEVFDLTETLLHHGRILNKKSEL